MTVMVDYATISPLVLANLIERRVPLAVCSYRDCGEDSFEFSVCGWLPLTSKDLAEVERILADYV